MKVVRNGNGRALPVPSGILAAVGATIGTQFEVRAIGDDLLFHHVGDTSAAPATPTATGTGAARVFTPSTVSILGTSAGVALLDDWDF